VHRHRMVAWMLILCLVLASACGPTPTSLPSTPTTALISTTPTGLPLTSIAIATPQPTLEPITSRFLYVEGVTVSTLAGDGHWGYRDGPGAQARFNGVEGGMAVDRQGNIYVAERGHRIRRITPDGLALPAPVGAAQVSSVEGMVSTVAGTGVPGYADGPASTAQFNYPNGVAVDAGGNVYVADTFNHRIRVIRPAGPALPAPVGAAQVSSSEGVVSTLAGDGEAGHRDGPAAQAQFDAPTDVAVDAAGVIYVADSRNNRIRTISPEGMVSTLAGSGERGFRDGPPDQAQFDGPSRLAVDASGNVYVCDSLDREFRGNHAVRRIAPDGTVTTLAGNGQPGLADGPLAEARFYHLGGLDVDTAGNLYVADVLSERIRVITPQGMVYTLAGTGASGYADGPGSKATFLWPKGVVLDSAGRLYVADCASNRIRVIDLPQSLVAAPPSPAPDPYAGQNVIKIGIADEAYYPALMSVSIRNAAELAVDEANAAGGVMVDGARYSFALVTAQDWHLPPDADAQAAARALLDQGVVAVVGHIFSENSVAAAEVLGPNGVVMVSPASSDPRLTQAGWPTVYRVTSNDAYLSPVAARMTYAELGIRRAVLLGEPDPHVKTFMDAWQQAFESLGGQVLGRFEADLEFPAEELVQLRTLAPEAVVFFSARKLDTARAVQQVLESGVEAAIVGVEAFSALPIFLVTLGNAAEGIYDAMTGRPRAAMPGYAAFAERYRETGFAAMPEPDNVQAKWAPFGYDAAGVIIAAIRLAAEPALPAPVGAAQVSGAAGTGAVTPESVATAMETFREQPYQGVTGVIQFDEYGDLLDQPVYFQKVENGQWVDVMPGER
jgi:ABC-type branched-subunit amino acid transport system substrate-binding protein/sugar lactone lactonase YvrE